MRARLLPTSACVLSMLMLHQTAASQDSFRDQLVLNPDETCSAGVPAPGDVVALALKGAKGSNYVIAGNNEQARLAVRGKASSAYSVFQITPSAKEDAVALYSLGHEKFILMDDKTRMFATSEPASALLLNIEDAGDGYIRVRLEGYPVWMRMNTNGYLDFRANQVASAAVFCAQTVVAD